MSIQPHKIVAIPGLSGGGVSLPSGTQGDALYFNGSSWVSLPAGTSGLPLKTQGAGANPTWSANYKATTIDEAGVGTGVTIEGTLLDSGAGTFTGALQAATVTATGTSTFTGNSTFGGSVLTDTIAEKTSANGVNIETVNLKDGNIILPDGGDIETDTITEATNDSGVIIEGVTCKDNDLSATDVTASAATSTATLAVSSTSAFTGIADFTTSLKADTINESTVAAGVTIDGVLCKDGGVVFAGGASIEIDTINEATSGSGVTIDGVLCKDNDISATDVTAAGNISAVGTVTGTTVTSSGNVTGAAVTATGAVTGATVTATGAVTGATVTATGAISANSLDVVTLVDTAAIITENITVTNGFYLIGVQTVAAGGTSTVLDLTKTIHHIDADVGGDIFTLADGVVGQIKTICMDSATDTATITPANLAGGTSITLNAAGETVILQFVDTQWYIIGGNAYTVI